MQNSLNALEEKLKIGETCETCLQEFEHCFSESISEISLFLQTLPNSNDSASSSSITSKEEIISRLKRYLENADGEIIDYFYEHKNIFKQMFNQHDFDQFDDAITTSKKALETYNKYQINDLYFKGHLILHFYEQYYFNHNWKKALEKATESRVVFKDTLVHNHRLIAQTEFNIGQVLGKFGDYSKVINQYKKAIDLNVSNRGEYNVV